LRIWRRERAARTLRSTIVREDDGPPQPAKPRAGASPIWPRTRRAALPWPGTRHRILPRGSAGRDRGDGQVATLGAVAHAGHPRGWRRSPFSTVVFVHPHCRHPYCSARRIRPLRTTPLLPPRMPALRSAVLLSFLPPCGTRRLPRNRADGAHGVIKPAGHRSA